jgi:hypothetical protein
MQLWPWAAADLNAHRIGCRITDSLTLDLGCNDDQLVFEGRRPLVILTETVVGAIGNDAELLVTLSE